MSVTQTDKQVLDRSLIHGMAWVGGIKWAGQGLTWVSTILVARILTPSDYGLVAMAIAFIAIVSMLADCGVDLVVVNFRGLDTKEMAQVNTLSCSLGVVAFFLSCLAAWPLSRFFQTPELAWVVIVMGITFLLQGLRAVPYALVQKDMQFKFVAIVEGVQTFCQAGSVITMALLGFGYWSLVAGTVVGPAVSTALLIGAHRQSFARPQWDKLKAIVAYSRDVVSSRVLWIVYSNADTFVIGRVLGSAALGAYSFGLSLANVAVEKVSGISSQVTASLFGAVQHDHAAIRRYFLMLTEGFAVISFPLTIGLAFVADDFVPFAFGEKWIPMILPLQILSVTAAYRSVAGLPSQVLFATKHSGVLVSNGLLGAVLLPLGFAVGSYWGVAGVAMVWAVVHPPINYRVSSYMFSFIGLSHGAYWQAFLPAATASTVMVVAVLGVKMGLPSTWELLPRLLCEIGAGGIAYLAVVWIGYRQRIQQFISLLRR